MTNKLKKSYKTIRLVFGDQLNASHSWYQETDSTILYVIAELPQEVSYVKHHIQKICAFFAAMENFSTALKKAGHHVLHLNMDDTQAYVDTSNLVIALAKQYKVEAIHYQLPDEYRLRVLLEDEHLAHALQKNKTKITVFSTEHFLLDDHELSDYFSPKKHHKMEFFYRKMRQRFNILMEDGKPLGGQWNYDANNRQKLKKSDLESIPEPLLFSTDVSDILHRLKKHNIDSFGHASEQLLWPVTRQQSLELLTYFCQHCLPNFGRFQDAMTAQTEHQWSLYHSRLSFALNSKMLHPLQVINAVIKSFYDHPDTIDIAQVEGFVRQILGWREYVRGVYWINMPAYAKKNHFNAQRKLPHYFWDGDTHMRCMHHAIGQSLEYAYAHHIQRLMVTGNFCLLTGINPDEVDAWYLGIYIDALEWVEMPNTRGMSQFADGGIVATKPYTAGGNYIHKMSDYCQGCTYKIKEKTTEDACPFNSLYWNFMIQHRAELEKNPRIGMVYRSWDKQDETIKEATIKRATWCLDNIEKL